MLNTYKNFHINSLIFKLTDYCNMGCSYCYRGSNKEKPRTVMSDELIEKVILDYIAFKKKTNTQHTPFVLVWHGGEPLTAGLDKFKKILAIEKKIQKKEKIEIINSVQTNATLINEDFAEFLSTNHFLVGLSMDGPKFIQDLNRYNKNKDSTYEAVMQGIEYLHQKNIYVNCIGVISNESSHYPTEIYNFFKDAGIGTLDLIPSFSYDEPSTLDIKKYSDFMIHIFDLWQKDGFKPMKIRFLNDIMNRLNNKGTHKKTFVECELAGCCGQNFSIGVLGEVFPCECLTPISSFYLGNITTLNFSELIATKGFRQMVTAFNSPSSDCFDCNILDYCRAGCLNRRLENPSLNCGKDLYCEARKDIFNHIQNYLNQKTPHYVS